MKPALALMSVVIANVIMHSTVIIRGGFHIEPLLNGFLIYAVMVQVIALLAAYARKFSFKDIGGRTTRYAISLQSFFLIIHVYVLLIGFFG